MTPAIMLFLLFSFFCIADGLTTYKVIQLGGSEGNKLVLWIMNKIGIVPALVLTRIFAIGLMWGFLLPYPIVMSLLTAGYAYIVVRNVKIIRNLSS